MFAHSGTALTVVCPTLFQAWWHTESLGRITRHCAAWVEYLKSKKELARGSVKGKNVQAVRSTCVKVQRRERKHGSGRASLGSVRMENKG